MKSDEIEKLVDDALLEGIIEVECIECGLLFNMKPMQQRHGVIPVTRL